MPVDETIHILGISGSLRKRSFNTATLKAAVELVPDGMEIEHFDIASIPLYNEDVREAGFPPAVAHLRDRIKRADGVLLVTPEYNYSIPGVLKNAIDWVSRPPDQPFDEKPIAIMGASPGMLGTVRAQTQLRSCFVFLNGHVLNRPEVFIGNATEKFDSDGTLRDEKTRAIIETFLATFKGWVRNRREFHRPSPPSRFASGG